MDVAIVAKLHNYPGTQHELAQKNWAEIPAFAKLGLIPEESIKPLDAAREELQEFIGIFN